MLPDFRKRIAFWKVPKFHPFVLVRENEYRALVEGYLQGKTAIKD
jgi:hypothetical protein